MCAFRMVEYLCLCLWGEGEFSVLVCVYIIIRIFVNDVFYWVVYA